MENYVKGRLLCVLCQVYLNMGRETFVFNLYFLPLDFKEKKISKTEENLYRFLFRFFFYNIFYHFRIFNVWCGENISFP